MLNRNRTWDGSEITGSMTGFKQYSTIPSGANDETIVITPKDILVAIKEIKRFIDLPELDVLSDVLYEHISKGGNPHGTKLSDYTDDVISAIYDKYVKLGGKLDKETYTKALFEVLHVATIEEMKEGKNENALLSIAGVRQYLHAHETDPDAHHDLIESMVPGSPVVNRPILAIHSRIGVPPAMTKKYHDPDEYNNRTVYTYIGKDGYLHTCEDTDTLPVDYCYGEPTIPMFGTRINEIPTCNNLSRYATVGAAKGSSIKSISGKIDSYSLVGTTNGNIQHTIAFSNLTLTAGITKTFSIYAKAGTCNTLMFEFTDLITKLPVRAIYDLDNGQAVVLNHATRYTVEIIPLRDGWNRCIFSLYSDVDMQNDLIISYFKSKNPNLQDFKFSGKSGEQYIHFYGMQLENGAGASPLIITTSTKLVRDGIYLTKDLDASQITDSLTVSMTVRNNVQNLGNDERPICKVTTDNSTASIVEFRKKGNIEIQQWASLVSGKTVHDTLINQDIFDSQTTEYTKISMSIGPNSINNGCNKLTSSKNSPEKYNVGTKLHFGSDDNGLFYEGYVRDITVYPCEVSEQQTLFLNGEEIYEY